MQFSIINSVAYILYQANFNAVCMQKQIYFILQHKAICEFPSKEFYKDQLQTDDRVRIERERQAGELESIWPGGSRKPFGFCDVIGKESEVPSGWKETTKVGHESKYNKEEARQRVSLYNSLHRTKMPWIV